MLKKALFLLLIFSVSFLNASFYDGKKVICENAYFFDKEEKLKIDEISKQTFHLMNQNGFSFGKARGNLWLKLVCTNRSTESDFILTTNESFYETAILYRYLNNKLEKQENGLLYPLSQRVVKSKLLSFVTPISPQKTETFYLQLKGKYNYVGKIEVFESDYFFLYELSHTNILFTFLFGVFIIIIFTNILFYFSIREKIYLYYSLYTFSTLIYLIIISGMLVYLGLQKYIYDLYAVAPLAMMAFVLFTKEVLETKKYFIFFDKYAKFLYVPFLFLAVLVIIQYNPWNNVINIYTLFVNILLLFVSIFILRKSKNKVSNFYSVGLICYFINFIFSILFGLGYLEYNFYTRNGMVFGIFLEVLFFQILIVKKYNEIKKSEINLKNEILNIQINKNNELEKQVNQRTKDLKELISEREILLKEVHHRVKNNFHSLIGILWMEDQKNNTNKNKELINHLKAVSKIHENLSFFDNLKFIKLDEYIDEIVSNVKFSTNIEFDIEVNVKDVVLPFESAMSLGVIINELITNSIKHYTNENRLYINLELKIRKSCFLLKVSDNNKKPISVETSGIGLSIIKHFSSILYKASYNFYYKNGNNFILKFQENRGQR